MKRLKKILKIFFISIIILILLGIGFTFLFGDKIEEIILNKINSKLKKELSLSEIEFSLFENFPDASVTFSNILIQESFQNSSDTLLFAEKGIIKLNIFNVISQDYSVNDVAFNKGVINIKYNENGEVNFDILKDSTGGNNNFELDNLDLTNSRFTFSNEADKIYTSSEIENINLSLKKEDEKITRNLNGNLENESLVVDEVDYINNKDMSFNSEIIISSDSIFITATNLSIGGVDFKNLNFSYLNSEYLLTTETENEDISNVIFATPKEYQYLYEDHEMSGKISADILIKKENNFENPYSEINFKLNNSKYKSKTQPFELENISSDCHFDNGNERNFASTQFRFSDFKSSKKGGEEALMFDINGNIVNSNFKIAGASRVDIEGKGESMVIRVSGASRFDGREFVSNSISLIASGASTSHIYSVDRISVDASSASKVYHYGTGSIDDFDLSSAASFKSVPQKIHEH